MTDKQAYQKKWREEHKEYRKASHLKWRLKNRDTTRTRWRVKWASMTPEQRRNKWLWEKYRVTLDQLRDLFKQQRGICPVCLGALSDFFAKVTRGQNTVVDHDHACCSGRRTCGKCIRGLLHDKCNRGLGFFKDNAETLRRALDYLGTKVEFEKNAELRAGIPGCDDPIMLS